MPNLQSRGVHSAFELKTKKIALNKNKSLLEIFTFLSVKMYTTPIVKIFQKSFLMQEHDLSKDLFVKSIKPMIKKSVKSEVQNLNNSRNWSNKTTAPFSFYEAMNYPIPDSETAFSRTQKNPHLESFLQIIRQRQWIFSLSIPFVETVLPCK